LQAEEIKQGREIIPDQSQQKNISPMRCIQSRMLFRPFLKENAHIKWQGKQHAEHENLYAVYAVSECELRKNAFGRKANRSHKYKHNAACKFVFRYH
jgi:hypothetical protein